jgi:hypothetical protein
LVVAKAREGRKYSIGSKESKKADQKSVLYSPEGVRTGLPPFSGSKSWHKYYQWLGCSQCSLALWVQYLRLGYCTRWSKGTTKSKKIAKSDLLSKQKYTLECEVGSSDKD